MDRQSTPTRSELKRMLCDSKAEPKALQLSLLEEITNGFSEEQEIGRGGFAVVYKGMLDNVTAVAVKRLSHTYMHEKQFQREVECLIKVKHKNVVQFLGYCADSQGIAESYNGEFVIADVQQRLLCFEYLPHGTLDKYITDASCGLEWRIRYKIINGICDGLHYLHQNRIVHLDLKPPNILLDGNMLPKIADFGLSRCFKEKQSRAITTKIGGTMGYLAPEFGSREITYQFDLYSLGVIIIEILTGKKGYASVEDVLEIWSNRLEKSHRAIHLEQIRVCTEIGIDCIESNPAKRPVSMQHIISRIHETGNTEGSVETVMKKSSALQAGTDSDSQHQGAPGLTSSETSSVCELVDEVPPMAVSATSSDQVRLISASNGLGEMNIEDFSYSGSFLVIDRTISGKANIFDEAIIARERRGKQQPVPHPLSRPAAMPFPLPSTSVSGSASASASSRGWFSLGTSAASDEPPDLGICRLAIDSRKQSHVLEERHFVTNNQVLEHTRSSEASVSPRKEFQLNIFELSTDGTTNCHARKSREIVPTRMPSSPPSSRGQHCPTSHVHSRAFGQSSGWKDDSRSSSSAHPLPLPPGTPCSSSRSLHSQWKKGKLLGSGTFGQVYLGFNSEGGQMCVIKEVTVTADDSHSKEYLGQLNQEMLLLNKLSHPNIVQYYGSEMSSKTLSVYLEFVSGGSIHKLLREYGPFGEAVIRNYTAQILSGLAYLHGRKTLHRDIKGANILLDPNGVIKLADFGMAISAYTSIKSVKGSPYWMAPEVIMNTNGYSLPVDIWSLGCTILEMATARRPWSQYEGVAALFKIANGKIIPDIPDHLSSEAKSFLRLCLQRDPAARPTAVQLIEHPWVKYQASVRNSRSGITRDM